MCRIETDGEALYLGPASGKGFETVGNGLYLMKQGRLYDGRGLILGPNSSLKISPFLVWLCDITFRKEKLYTLKMKIDETDGKYGHIYRLKNIDEIQKILIA